MKRLRFHELLLLSRSEQRARRERFDPRATVIRGSNGTGKSSLVKSIYWTMGAEPATVHARWKTANVTASLKFSVDNVGYRMIRFADRLTLFDANDNLIRSFADISTDTSLFFADFFDFHLLLNARGDDKQATPAFLFLPFYLDQDGGWTRPHASFANLQQFAAPRKDMLAFHCGIRPSAYYVAKAKMTKAAAEAKPLADQRATLAHMLEKIEARMALVDFDLDLAAYQKEIDILLQRSQSLRELEEQYKQELVDSFNERQSIDEQTVLITSALRDLRKDRETAGSLTDPVICPTCHALYENGFSDRFDIALDEDTCLELLSNLKIGREQAERRWTTVRASVDAAKTATAEIETVLNAKRGTVALADVLRREGQKDVSGALRQEIAELDGRIGGFDADRRSALADMQALDSAKHKKPILAKYRGEMTRLLELLDVPNMPASGYKKLDASIRETGSHLPRAILAYFFAIVRTIDEHSTSTFCPIVIDSPHQQDQDPDNFTRILTCIREQTPDDAQLILATTTDTGFEFGGRTIDLTERNYLLRSEDYVSVNNELRELIDASLS